MANYKVKKLTTVYNENYPYNPEVPEVETPDVIALENVVTKVYQLKWNVDGSDRRIYAEVNNPRAEIGNITGYWSTSTLTQGCHAYYYLSGRNLVIVTKQTDTLSTIPITFGSRENRLALYDEDSWSEIRNINTYIMGQIKLK